MKIRYLSKDFENAPKIRWESHILCRIHKDFKFQKFFILTNLCQINSSNNSKTSRFKINMKAKYEDD